MTPNRKRKNTALNTPIMLFECKNLGVKWVEFNPNSYRLTKEGFVTIDYFPGTGKIFFHDVKDWGETEEVGAFLRYHFNEKKV